LATAKKPSKKNAVRSAASAGGGKKKKRPEFPQHLQNAMLRQKVKGISVGLDKGKGRQLRVRKEWGSEKI